MSFSTFFSKLQEAPWYRSFLNPVINQIDSTGKLLDIGTGSGKLIQILASEKDIECVGVDTNSEMLDEARKKMESISAELIEISPNQKLPFEVNSFKYITICSVLLHLKNEDIDSMMKDCLGLIGTNGKIIILTPTGSGNALKLTRHFPSLKNKGMYIWHRSTKKRALKWTENAYLKKYAEEHKLNYSTEIVMNGFAQLEVITK